MRLLKLLPILLAAVNLGAAYFSHTDTESLRARLAQASLDELENRRDSILGELSGLARFSMNSGVGRIGYRSNTHPDELAEEWIEIDLGGPVPLDAIALVPAIWRDAERGFIADAFPQAFDIEVGHGDRVAGRIIARYADVSGILPRVAPFVIGCDGVAASWIRITARRLSPRKFDGLHLLQLSEVFVFSGPDNVALGKPVRCSSSSVAGSGAWSEAFLVDGMTPYLMDAAGGTGSLAFANDAEIGDKPFLVIDLESPVVVDQLILHVIEQTDTVPQAFPGDYGVPFQFTLEGALSEDFAEPVVLLDYQRENIFALGPIISLPLHPQRCRFVRLTATKPYIFRGIDLDGSTINDSRLGFAEIEVLSSSTNVARGKRVTSSFNPGQTVRRIETLTDGMNLYGDILPVRDWIMQLAERHDLEMELPLVSRELERRYERQKQNLYWLKLSLGALLMTAIVVILVIRFRQQRVIYRTRERITADLHDVLGGNISAIALLGQLAQNEVQNPEGLSGYLRRIENLAGRTRNALKYISDMLNQPGIYQNLLAEMQRIGHGLTEGLEHEFEHTGDAFIPRIDQRRRIDIFLFYKECLVNIIRHARATRISSRLTIDAQVLELVVRDNGIGLPGRDAPLVPPSLKRRARIMGAKVVASRNEGGGSQIQLLLRWNQRWPLGVLSGFFPHLLDMLVALRNRK